MKSNIIKAASDIARLSTHRFRLGAVIFRGNWVIGCGYNNPYKTHPKSNTPYKTIHAEFMAAIEALHVEDIQGAEIYVHRIRRDNKVALAKPCKHCIEMLVGYGLNKIYYSTDVEGLIGELDV